MIHYSNPYSVKAKQAYKRYLSMPGYDASMVLPPDLKHHPPSYTSSRHTFTRVKPKKPKAPAIEGRTAFKNFLASFTVHNHTNLKKLNGFKLLDLLIPTLQKYLQEHNGIKFYFNARYEMRRTLQGQVLEVDKDWWKTGRTRSCPFCRSHSFIVHNHHLLSSNQSINKYRSSVTQFFQTFFFSL